MREEEIEQTQILKTRENKKRIKSDYGKVNYVSYALVRLQKKYPNLTRKEVNNILTLYLKECRDEISLGQRVNLPNRLGSFYVTKKKRSVYYDSDTDTIINTLPINKRETFEFWRENPEKIGKTFIRYTNEHSNQYTFNLRYNYRTAKFKNKNIYAMGFNSRLKKDFSRNIIDKKVDAFIEKDYKRYKYD